MLVLAFGLSASVAWADMDGAVDRLQGGDVLLLRHAIAPGFGDPEGFRIDDCSTQRNLSEAGRRQARAIGDWLRARGIREARVYSSQWCRCLETAELLNLGEVSPLPALNSFFERPADREPNLRALNAFLASYTPRNQPLVLVTHQVTVSALTDIFPGSGEGVVAKVAGNGELSDFTRLRFDE
jgi:broad specificity phosphatase PhoE